MTTGLTLQQLFSETTTEQFLVPEIQRDYVWEPANIDSLLASLRAAYVKSKRVPALLISGEDADEQVERSFKDYYRRQRHSHHLGFVYAYHDAAYPTKAFLIDGQQRLLSLYLMLLARAVEEDAQDDFRMRYLLNNHSVRLDYRVREATHDFLQRFVEFVLCTPKTADIKAEVHAQYWYFRAYEQDVTITHVVDNYAHLARVMQQDGPDYDYLNNFVRFWYFDSGDSIRGENLYLSLNSTGLMTSASENQRAFLLGTIKEADQKKSWGTKIERWQDFFWKRRASNPNADKGFNEFFRWLRALGPLLATAAPVDLVRPTIQQALKSPRWLNAEQATPGFSLPNADRLMQVLDRLFSTANKYDLAGLNRQWLAPEKDTLTLLETFQLLPVLAYCLARPQTASWEHVHRVVRYFCNLRHLPSIAKANAEDAARLTSEAMVAAYQLGQMSEGDPVALPSFLKRGTPLLPEEEADKLQLYCEVGADRAAIEQLLWQLEDEEWNHGEVRHLFLAQPLTAYAIADIQLVSQRYFDLQLTDGKSQSMLLSLLLLYGNCRIQDKYSGMYEQYDYGNWERILRNQGGVFKAFFSEFLLADEALEAFYAVKRSAYYAQYSIDALLADYSFHNQLRVLVVLNEYLSTFDNGNAQPLLLWSHGGTVGRFYDGLASGYESAPVPDQLLFGEHTLRFWNTEDRLTSAWWRKHAISDAVYARFQQLLPGSHTYRQFAAEALLTAGALLEEATVLLPVVQD